MSSMARKRAAACQCAGGRASLAEEQSYSFSGSGSASSRSVWSSVSQFPAEMYNQLTSHISWTLLLLKFLFDSSIGLHSRTERVDRNGVVTDAPAAPGLDYLERAAECR